MKSTTRFASNRMSLGIVIGIAAWLLLSPAHAQGQVGDNAVYNSSGNCSSTSPCAASSAFIDASMFATAADTICSTIYKILQPSGYSAAVIDARGLPGSTGASMTCAAGTTPWNNGVTYLNKPSTILLPATGGTTPTPIIIPTPWVLPSNTHLIGEGDGIPSSSSTPVTTIQATGAFPVPGPMIQFGSSSGCCSAISVENLTLDGLGASVNGIVNQYSQDLSYVNHVTLYQIRGIGLLVSTSANNSGPYSNLTFDTVGYRPRV